METVEFKKDDFDDLINSMCVEGKTIVFSPEAIEESGRLFMEACIKNEKEEHAHMAEVWRDSYKTIIF